MDAKIITLKMTEDGRIIAEIDGGDFWGIGKTVEEAIGFLRGSWVADKVDTCVGAN